MNIPSGLHFPACIHDLGAGCNDVRRLLDLAPTSTKAGSGSRKTAEAVYRGGVVLACAVWEAYLEDLAIEAILLAVEHHRAGRPLGPGAYEVATRNERKLSQENIKRLDRAAVRRKRNMFIGRFDNPKTANVDGLFERALDLGGFSDAWVLRGRSLAKRLDSLVTLRGDIAHRSRGPLRVTKRQLSEQVVLVEQLAVLSCNRVRQWLVESLESEPWGQLPLSIVA